MKTATKLLGLVALVLLVGGAYYFPKSQYVTNNPVTYQTVGSAVGTTFGTAKVAQINWTLTNGATSTSVLNTDSFDRVVDTSFVSCSGVGTSLTAVTGAGLANLIISAATSSTASPTTNGNANLVMVNNLATSSAVAYTASTTVSGVQSRFWATGTYMNFYSNATNTAACTVGVYYHGS